MIIIVIQPDWSIVALRYPRLAQISPEYGLFAGFSPVIRRLQRTIPASADHAGMPWALEGPLRPGRRPLHPPAHPQIPVDFVVAAPDWSIVALRYPRFAQIAPEYGLFAGFSRAFRRQWRTIRTSTGLAVIPQAPGRLFPVDTGTGQASASSRVRRDWLQITGLGPRTARCSVLTFDYPLVFTL